MTCVELEIKLRESARHDVTNHRRTKRNTFTRIRSWCCYYWSCSFGAWLLRHSSFTCKAMGTVTQEQDLSITIGSSIKRSFSTINSDKKKKKTNQTLSIIGIWTDNKREKKIPLLNDNPNHRSEPFISGTADLEDTERGDKVTKNKFLQRMAEQAGTFNWGKLNK